MFWDSRNALLDPPVSLSRNGNEPIPRKTQSSKNVVYFLRFTYKERKGDSGSRLAKFKIELEINFTYVAKEQYYSHIFLKKKLFLRVSRSDRVAIVDSSTCKKCEKHPDRFVTRILGKKICDSEGGKGT